MNEEELKNMELHEWKSIGNFMNVIRVYNGWIYEGGDGHLTFVPEFNNVNADCFVNAR